MLKLLLIGASGMVGSRFVELLSSKYQLLTPDYLELDITKLDSVNKYKQIHNPQAIINFAAFTDVTAAESQRNNRQGSCWQLNVEGVKNIAAVFNSVLKIQISTDMVFPGSEEYKGPYSEDQKPEEDCDKLTWYGFTKSQAEKHLKDFHDNTTILRIIYPVRASYPEKLDYIRKPLKLFDEGKLYPMFSDQQISISFIDEICGTLETIIERRMNGFFHATSTDVTTPYELINYVLEKARGVKSGVKKSSLRQFLETVDNPVRYPVYGGLIATKTMNELGVRYSSSREIVDKLIKQGIVV